MLLCSKHSSTELLLRVGHICPAKMHECLISLHSAYEPRRSAVLQRFERSNTVEICNGMMFDFYPGLPHIQIHGVVVRVERPVLSLSRLRFIILSCLCSAVFAACQARSFQRHTLSSLSYDSFGVRTEVFRIPMFTTNSKTTLNRGILNS